jgi:hypothetical protein
VRVILLITQLLIPVVLTCSGLAMPELVDQPDPHQAMLEFGVPTRNTTHFASLMSLIELIDTVLVIARSGWLGALATLILLAFTAAVGYYLALGNIAHMPLLRPRRPQQQADRQH